MSKSARSKPSPETGVKRLFNALISKLKYLWAQQSTHTGIQFSIDMDE